MSATCQALCFPRLFSSKPHPDPMRKSSSADSFTDGRLRTQPRALSRQQAEPGSNPELSSSKVPAYTS